MTSKNTSILSFLRKDIPQRFQDAEENLTEDVDELLQALHPKRKREVEYYPVNDPLHIPLHPVSPLQLPNSLQPLQLKRQKRLTPPDDNILDILLEIERSIEDIRKTQKLIVSAVYANNHGIRDLIGIPRQRKK